MSHPIENVLPDALLSAGEVSELLVPVPSPFAKEGENGPNIPLQEKFHRGILRGPRNISDAR